MEGEPESTQSQSFYELIKGQIHTLSTFGLPIHEEIIAALPIVFDFSKHSQITNQKNLENKIREITHTLRFSYQKNNLNFQQKELSHLLTYTWPMILEKLPQSQFKQNLKLITQYLQLNKTHVCLMFYYHEKFPSRFPEILLKETLEHFKVPQNEIDNEILIDMITGEICIQSILELNKFDVEKEFYKFDEREEKNLTIWNILSKMLIQKKQMFKLISLINPHFDKIFSQIDKWLKPTHCRILTTFHILKTMLLIESLYEYKNKDENSPHKSQYEAIEKVLIELSYRLLNQLFSTDYLNVLIIISWILNSRFWIDNPNNKATILEYAVVCYEVSLDKVAIRNPGTISQKVRAREGLISGYLNRLMEKYFVNWTGLLPKYYSKVNLNLLKSNKENCSQMTVSLQMTASIQSKSSIEMTKKTSNKNNNTQNSSIEHIFASFQLVIENLSMHKVYVIILLLFDNLGNERDGEETETEEQKVFHTSEAQIIEKLFYTASRSLKMYEKLFPYNSLSREIGRLICKLPIHMKVNKETEKKEKELFHIYLPDLQLFKNNDELNAEFACKVLLNCPIFYSLHSFYQIELASVIFNRLSFGGDTSQNNNSNKIKTKATDNVEFKEIDQTRKVRSNLVNVLYNIGRLITTKIEEIELFGKLLLIEDEKVLNIMYNNLIYYALVKLNKTPTSGMKKKKKTMDIEDLLNKLFVDYFQEDLTGAQDILKILVNAYKVMEDWSYHTRGLGRGVGYDEYGFFGGKSGRNIGEVYWEILVESANKRNNLFVYSKKLEEINCIKESIYFMQMHTRNQPKKPDEDNSAWISECQYLFKLYERLDPYLGICRAKMGHKIGEKSFEVRTYEEGGKENEDFGNKETNIFGETYNKNKGNELQNGIILSKENDLKNKKKYRENLKWLERVEELRGDKDSDCLWSILMITIDDVLDKEDSEEIDEVLHEMHLLSVFHFFYHNGEIDELHEVLNKCNNKDICLSIAHSLQSSYIELLNLPLPNNEEERNLRKNQEMILSEYFYEQKLRFNQLEELDQELSEKDAENMTFEEMKTAIILNSKLKRYEQVLLLCSQMTYLHKNQPIHEILFYNLEALYRAVMFYPADRFIKEFDKIVFHICSIRDKSSINKKSTNPLFLAYKFLCENYEYLSKEVEITVIRNLNLYLEKVFENHNKELAEEAVYFILRFILIEARWSQDLIANKNLFPFWQYSADIFEPNKWLLINNIGEDEQKNFFICEILIKIAEHNPVASSWWIFALANHIKARPEINERENVHDLDWKIKEIGDKINAKLEEKKLSIKPYTDWLKNLLEESTVTRVGKIPLKMVSPFNNNTYLEEVISIQSLGQGKSKPLILEFKVTGEKKTIFIIRKFLSPNTSGFSGFRTESATANFFKDSKLLDSSITYSIVHLSKNCLLIEHINHKATLDSLMVRNMDKNSVYKLKTLMEELAKGKGMKKVLGPLYENEISKMETKLYSFFIETGIIKNWWLKYTNFVKTYAQWSFLCHIIGLGDRHTNNILVAEDGKTIHIDFEYIFDSGKMLPCPEWVPFRMTRALVSELSIIEPYGLIFAEFMKTADRYSDHSREIWHAEGHFSFFKNINISRAISSRASLKGNFKEAVEIFQKATNTVFLRNMFVGWGSYK